ncbi:MAG TPA: beta-ketoacyl-ACP synthase II [Gammaproteobacteria bacterium]|nr:beta-ketoacyl-ACP synthase II [Gammaproteobacteria bacterium]
MTRRRVVVTGLGVVSPVGNNVTDTWRGVCDGRSGIAAIERFDVSAFSTRFGGEIRNFDIEQYLEPKEARKCDPFIHFGIAAAEQAIADAGLEDGKLDRNRIGVAMGSGIGGILTIEANYERLAESGPRKISPFFVPATIINMISGHVSIRHGFCGPNIAIVTACTTSTHCIGLAARMIQTGDADLMLAGGAEHAITPLGLGGFCAARALSTRNDDPAGASRPFDRDRDGFVLSDGAACMAIEELEHAKARGARIYAEFAGFGMSADAHHITAPAESGEGAYRCMANAIADAGIPAETIGYVNAHGTSTPLGDVAESTAIKRAFGDHARALLVSSTKSTTGHMIGAAGGAEAIFTVLALVHGIVPPTINIENQDPACDLDCTPNAARELTLEAALSNSFGFGGTNGTVVFKRFD